MKPALKDKHAPGRIGVLLIIASTLSLFGLSFSSCGNDDPANPVHNHRPPGGSDSGNQNNGNDDGKDDNGGNRENNENGNDNGGGQEETAPIVGTWMRNDNAEKLAFGKDGRYAAYINDDGKEGWHEHERGHYIYHELSRILWIETDGEEEDRSVEYKCIFGENGSLTLWSLDNKPRKFRKIKDEAQRSCAG